jgi:hypothetical protein
MMKFPGCSPSTYKAFRHNFSKPWITEDILAVPRNDDIVIHEGDEAVTYFKSYGKNSEWSVEEITLFKKSLTSSGLFQFI